MKETLNTNESGFTLLESLIALMLSSIILLLMTSILLQLAKINELIIRDAQPVLTSENKIFASRQIEWHIFLAQLENYLENTQLIDSSSSQIIVQEKDPVTGKDQNIRYGQAKSGYENFYRRNNNGYHEMLTDIKKMNIQVKGDCLKLSFIFQNGEQYKGRIWVDGWQEKES